MTHWNDGRPCQHLTPAELDAISDEATDAITRQADAAGLTIPEWVNREYRAATPWWRRWWRR